MSDEYKNTFTSDNARIEIDGVVADTGANRVTITVISRPHWAYREWIREVCIEIFTQHEIAVPDEGVIGICFGDGREHRQEFVKTWGLNDAGLHEYYMTGNGAPEKLIWEPADKS